MLHAEGIPRVGADRVPGKGHMLGYEATAEVVAQLIAYATLTSPDVEWLDPSAGSDASKGRFRPVERPVRPVEWPVQTRRKAGSDRRMAGSDPSKPVQTRRKAGSDLSKGRLNRKGQFSRHLSSGTTFGPSHSDGSEPATRRGVWDRATDGEFGTGRAAGLWVVRVGGGEGALVDVVDQCRLGVVVVHDVPETLVRKSEFQLPIGAAVVVVRPQPVGTSSRAGSGRPGPDVHIRYRFGAGGPVGARATWLADAQHEAGAFQRGQIGGSSRASATIRSTSITGLAASPGTDVEPTWVIRAPAPRRADLSPAPVQRPQPSRGSGDHLDPLGRSGSTRAAAISASVGTAHTGARG